MVKNTFFERRLERIARYREHSARKKSVSFIMNKKIINT